METVQKRNKNVKFNNAAYENTKRDQNQDSQDDYELIEIPQKTDTVTQKKEEYLPKEISVSSQKKEELLRQRLKWFFSNPCQRCTFSGYACYARVPAKLIVQIFKVVFVTTQLMLFANDRAGFVDYMDKSNLAMKRLFLKSWLPNYETMPYPPAVGVYGIYDEDDLLDHVNFAVNQLFAAPSIGMGSLYFNYKNNTIVPVEICLTYYKERQYFPNETLIINSDEIKECIDVMPQEESLTGNNTGFVKQFKYNITAELVHRNQLSNLNRLLEVTIDFSYKSVRMFQSIEHCYKIFGQISFDNSDRNGQALVDLVTNVAEQPCTGEFDYWSSRFLQHVVIAVFVILLNLASLFFCIGALYKSIDLLKETKTFFREEKRLPLSTGECMEFFKGWDIIIILNDILTLSGTAVKLWLEKRRSWNLTEKYDYTSVLLGVGCLLVWIGLMRYLAFIPKFNLLFLTIKKAFRHVLRYMVCVMLLFAGFTMCGWVILGPYNIKFRDMSSTAECLFAVVQGDEMFITFSGVTSTSRFIWWVSRLYLYTYIALFTAVAINLFIAILADTYETIKNYYKNGFPRTNLSTFVSHSNRFTMIDECHMKNCCFSCGEDIQES